MLSFTYSPAQDSSLHPPIPMDNYDRSILIKSGIFVGIIIAISTIIHYYAPWIFHDPPATPNPLADKVTLEILNFLLAFLCGVHCYRNYGGYAATLFFTGSFCFAGMMENMMILSGRFGWIPFQTFFYIKGGFLYFLDVPITICLGWFILAYSSVFAASLLLPKANHLWHALLAAFICMDIDLWTDPVMTNPANHLWQWLGNPAETTNLFSIPLYNFFGWFGLIFFFGVLWFNAQNWQERLGKQKATAYYFIGIPILIALYLGLTVIIELTIRHALPHVNITIGGI